MTAEEEWLARRLTGIGASDVTAARHGAYGGAAKVVALRIGLGDPDPIDPDLARRGHEWEQAVADGVLAHHGLYVHGEQMHLAHPDRPRWMATLDGLLSPEPETDLDGVTACLEIKTRGIGARWRWDLWETQAQFQMLVAGLPRALIAVATIVEDFDPATGSLAEHVDDVRYRWVDADPAEQLQLGELADELWAWVEKRELPPADSAEALPYVKAANATADDEATADIDDLAGQIERREELLAAAKAAEAEAKEIEARVRQAMGEATEALTSDKSWRVRCGHPIAKFTSKSEADWLDVYGEEHPELTKTVVDRDAVKREMPDIYDALKRQTPDRRLTTKKLRRNGT